MLGSKSVRVYVLTLEYVYVVQHTGAKAPAVLQKLKPTQDTVRVLRTASEGAHKQNATQQWGSEGGVIIYSRYYNGKIGSDVN